MRGLESGIGDVAESRRVLWIAPANQVAYIAQERLHPKDDSMIVPKVVRPLHWLPCSQQPFAFSSKPLSNPLDMGPSERIKRKAA
jgi:hypothetical protein